jgi:RNA polymerase sigma-70 factor, ECF subfamily
MEPPPDDGWQEMATAAASDAPRSAGTMTPNEHSSPSGSQSRAAGSEEIELVRRAQGGDAKAIDLLARRYQQKVYGIAYRMSGLDAEEARDTAQEALLQIFRNLKHFEGRSKFSTWLYRVAVNTCQDARRRRSRWKWLLFSWHAERHDDNEAGSELENIPDGEGETSVLAQIGGQEFKREVQEVLRTLSEKQRLVFQLKVFEELSIVEISSATGMAEGTVKTHLFRATQAIRNRLRGWSEK